MGRLSPGNVAEARHTRFAAGPALRSGGHDRADAIRTALLS